MEPRDIEQYCKDFGVPYHVEGKRLRIMDLTRLPGEMRTNFDERGFYVAMSPATQTTSDAKAEAAEEPKPLKGKLPDDFPGHAALEAGGITTYAKVRKQLDDLTSISGIGDATAEKIKAAMGESSESEEEPE